MEKLRDDGKAGNVSCPVTHCSWCSKRGKVRQPLDLEPAWSIHRCPWALWFFDVCKLNWLTFPIEFMLHYLRVWEYSFTGTTFLNVKKSTSNCPIFPHDRCSGERCLQEYGKWCMARPACALVGGWKTYIDVKKVKLAKGFWTCCFTK